MQDVTEIESGKIVIKILNKGFFKKDIVGIFDLDVTNIYFQNDHSLKNQWLALSNPLALDNNEITAYLMVSISVCGPKDDQVALIDSQGKSEQTDNVMMPASIVKNYK